MKLHRTNPSSSCIDNIITNAYPSEFFGLILGLTVSDDIAQVLLLIEQQNLG